MPYAVRITEENVEELIDWGKSVHMNLDHIRYEFGEYLEFPTLGPRYLITDGTLARNNVTCTTMSSTSFFKIWKFRDEELPDTHFSEIEKV